MAATITKRASDVRTQELNFSQVLINESTSVALIPIVSKQGRITPAHFTDPNDFLFEYGDSDPSVSFAIQCGKDFFREGNDAWAIRVVGFGYKYSAALLYRDGGVTKLMGIAGGVSNPDNPDWDVVSPNANVTPLALFYPNRGPGSYGDNFAVSIQAAALTHPSSLAASSASQGGVLSASTYEYRVASIGVDGSETLATNPVQIVISSVGVSNVVNLSWAAVPNAVGYKIYGRSANGGLLATVGGAVVSFTDDGSLTPNTNKLPITDPADLGEVDPSFTVSIYDMDQNTSTPVETFNCTLAYNVDLSGTQTELEDRINAFSQYMRVTSNAHGLTEMPTVGSVSTVTRLTGGDSGAAPTSSAIVNALQVFTNKELYPINMIINAGFADPIVQKGIDTLCQKRGDCIGLLDVPSAQQKFQAAIDYRNLTLNLNSSYSALFCPDVLEADYTNGRQIYVPFSGWAAALVARTDRVANPSYSIAGLNRGLVDVLKARYSYDDGQATAMFKAQVNYLRTFVGQGIALWEQQTLSAEYSALSWLSVRRLVNIIKTSLYKFLLYALQEPNTDQLGLQIEDALNSYLGAWVDAQGLSSFYVESDAGNNTPALENAGIRLVQVVLVPVIPTHEIQLQVIVSKQGVSFKEVLSRVNG